MNQPSQFTIACMWFEIDNKFIKYNISWPLIDYVNLSIYSYLCVSQWRHSISDVFGCIFKRFEIGIRYKTEKQIFNFLDRWFEFTHCSNNFDFDKYVINLIELPIWIIAIIILIHRSIWPLINNSLLIHIVIKLNHNIQYSREIKLIAISMMVSIGQWRLSYEPTPSSPLRYLYFAQNKCFHYVKNTQFVVFNWGTLHPLIPSKMHICRPPLSISSYWIHNSNKHTMKLWNKIILL